MPGPAVRAEPPDSGSELQALTGFLEWQRESILLTTDGLTREQLGLLSQRFSP
jgi:hypothetical protein